MIIYNEYKSIFTISISKLNFNFISIIWEGFVEWSECKILVLNSVSGLFSSIIFITNLISSNIPRYDVVTSSSTTLK